MQVSMNTSNTSYQTQLDVALQAAMAAADVVNRYFSTGVEVVTKADNSPVTAADIEAEKVIRNVLLKAFPEYGFYGEETGETGRDAEYLWLVDPIDGTKSFIRGMPYFSTQIALMHKGQLVVGVSSAPKFLSLAGAGKESPGQGEIAFSMRDSVATINQQPVHTSAQTSLAGAFLSSGNLATLAADSAAWQCYAKLVGSVARVRGYGDFCHYHQLACGQADVVVESDVNILDIAALTVIVEQAGGIFTDLAGNAIDLETTSVLAASTPELHAEALTLLSA